MASLSDTDIKEIKTSIQNYKDLMKIFLIALLVLTIILMGDVYYSFTFIGFYLDSLLDSTLANSSEISNLSSVFLSITAFVISLCAVIVSALFPCYEAIKNLEDKLRDDKLKKRKMKSSVLKTVYLCFMYHFRTYLLSLMKTN